VPLVEEGWLEGEVPSLVVRQYLTPLVERGIDALVLGCTHYPLLMPVIARELAALRGSAAPVVDSAHATADDLSRELRARGLLRVPENPEAHPAQLCMLVTDMPRRFSEVASQFLGRALEGLDVRAMDL